MAMQLKKSDPHVRDLYERFGGANFADILNRLWIMGKDPKELQKALATTAKGTNDPTDIITRLLNKGIVTSEEMLRAPTLPIPEGVQWAFGPENVQDGVVKPWHTETFAPPTPAPTPGVPQPTSQPTGPSIPGAPPSRVPSVPGAGGGQPDVQGMIQRAIDNAMAEGRDITIDEADDLIRRTYGFSAFALDIPEVRKVLEDAAREDWDDNRIIGAITNTGWWKRTGDKERQWTALAAQDPETAKRRIQGQRDTLFSQARASGFAVDEGRLNQISELSLKFGWSQQEIQRALASEFKYDPTGEKQTFATNLKRMAKEYVIPMSNDTIERWGQRLLSGEMTEDDFQSYLTDQAKSMFPGMEAALDRGVSVRQFADPYLQIAGKMLEINPDEIDLADGKWMRALNQQDPKTGDRTTMSLSDWEATLKLDPQYGWDQTKQARQTADEMSASILRTFGSI